MDDFFGGVWIGCNLVGGVVDDIIIWYIEIVCNGYDMMDSYDDCGFFWVFFDGLVDFNGGWVVFIDYFGCLNDFLFGDLGNFGGLFGCILLDVFS